MLRLGKGLQDEGFTLGPSAPMKSLKDGDSNLHVVAPIIELYDCQPHIFVCRKTCTRSGEGGLNARHLFGLKGFEIRSSCLGTEVLFGGENCAEPYLRLLM